MFPYKDDNPTLVTPIVTLVLIAANIAAWILLQGAGADPALSDSICRLGVIPGHLFGSISPGSSVPLGMGRSCQVGNTPGWLTVVTSMFTHGGWLHLIGNMWFLWVFGNNVEDSTGRGRFLLFYLLCGAIAALTQSAANPGSPIPMVGASGAISGIMGAYIVLFPRVRVHMLIFLFIFITTIRVPAWMMLGYWFLLQLASTVPAVQGEGGGVAFLAHAGGFVAGMLLVLLFRNPRLVALRAFHHLPT